MNAPLGNAEFNAESTEPERLASVLGAPCCNAHKPLAFHNI
jgi:hypothetical protein